MSRFINPFTDVGFKIIFGQVNGMPWAAQNAVFQRLAEVAEVSKLSKEDRLEYDHALKRYRDTLNAMAGAEQKGREEAIRDNARRMKADGMPAELIAKYTGLTIEDIENV